MSSYTEHLHSCLGGLTRRQVLTATPPRDILAIFEARAAHAANYNGVVKFSPEVRANAMQLVIKLGYAGASKATGIHAQTIGCWVDLVCSRGALHRTAGFSDPVPMTAELDQELQRLRAGPPDKHSQEPMPKQGPALKDLPYLHLLTASLNEPGPYRKSYSAEYKQYAAKSAVEYGTRVVAQKLGMSAAVLKEWVHIAEYGCRNKSKPLPPGPKLTPPPQEPARAQPTAQYGLKEVSPLASQVAALEAENLDLRTKLEFFSKFKTMFNSL